MSQLPRYESYKDSGVQWLGEIPSHWDVTRLKFILAVKKNAIKVGPFGSDLKGDDFQTSGYPVYNQRTVLDNNFIDGTAFISEEKFKDLSGFKIEPLDILVTTRGTIGKIAVAPKDVNDGIIHPCIMKFSINRGAVTEKLLKYLFNEIDYVFNQFVLASGTTTIPVIYSDTLKNIVLPLPPITEQKIIAEFLDKRLAQVDALIAKQETLLEKLAEQRVALISHAVTKGLNPDVEMKESKIRWVKDIPIHWNVVPVRYLFEFKNNQRIPVSAEDRGKMSEKIYPYYGASGIIDFVEDYIFDEDLLLVAEDGANLLSRSTPLAFKASGKYWVNNHAHIIKPVDNNLTYWEYVLALYDFTPLISGSAQPKLTKDNLASIKLPNPPDKEKHEICNFLDKPLENLKEQKLKIEKILETLKEYRSTLITQVVTGKIDVRNLKVN